MAGTKGEGAELMGKGNLRKECRHYEGCAAPLCPLLSDDENQKGLWYPEEEICRKRKDAPDWVRQQRKILKKVGSQSQRFYFTLEMLIIPFRVTKEVGGLDPDQPRDEEPRQLEQWFKRNKGTGKRKLSEAQRSRKRENLKRIQESKKTNGGTI
jgi:hypothetical protein